MTEARTQTAAVLPLALFSVVALALEVLVTRILSYSVHTLLLYAVLGVALLGFGIAGTLVAVWPRLLDRERLKSALAWSSIGAVYSVVLSFACFLRITSSLHAVDALTFLSAALVTLPFLAIGFVVTLVLSAAGSTLPRAYAANLIGSGLGCFVPILLLGPLDEQHLLAVLAGVAWLAAWAYVRGAETSWSAPSVIVHALALPLVIAGFIFAEAVFPLAPEPAPLGQVSAISAYAKSHGIRMIRRHDASSAVGRIEIFEFQNVPGYANPYPFMFYAQDSSAGSTLVHWDGRTRSAPQPPAAGAPISEVAHLCSDTIYSAGYFRPRPRVLVIGLGGGPDLLCALYHEATHVDVVDINPRTVAAIRGPFSAFLGHAPQNPAVTFHVQDGRSFAHGTRAGSYDLIQLSGTDTKQNLASGSLTLSENHLYTVEAFRDYLQSLTPTGVLAIIRFGEPEALRLANTAASALRSMGATAPQLQISVVHDGVLYGVMVRRTAFPQDETNELLRCLSPTAFRGVDVFFAKLYELPFHKPVEIAYTPFGPSNPTFTRFFEQVQLGESGPFTDAYPFDIRPTTDDRPFFFDIFRHDDLSTFMRAPHMKTLRDILFALGALSLAFVLAPVLLRRQALRGSALVVAPLYFTAIGLAYLFVEVWLLARFSVYLGHQTHGLSVVLSTLLVTTGLGAWWSPRAARSSRMRATLGASLAALVLVLGSYNLTSIVSATWSQPFVLRVLITIACITPLGFCMGLPMPSGLSWARSAYPGSVALCVGINAFASVIATIAVLPISLFYGYGAVLGCGAALYVLASLLAFGMRRPTTPT